MFNTWRKRAKDLRELSDRQDKDYKSLLKVNVELREDFKNFKTDTEKVVTERDDLKTQVRKQIEADLLLISMKIVNDITGVKKATEPASLLHQQQQALQRQLSGLQENYPTHPLGQAFPSWGLRGYV